MSWVPLVGGILGATIGGYASDHMTKKYGLQGRIALLVITQVREDLLPLFVCLCVGVHVHMCRVCFFGYSFVFRCLDKKSDHLSLMSLLISFCRWSQRRLPLGLSCSKMQRWPSCHSSSLSWSVSRFSASRSPWWPRWCRHVCAPSPWPSSCSWRATWAATPPSWFQRSTSTSRTVCETRCSSSSRRATSLRPSFSSSSSCWCGGEAWDFARWTSGGWRWTPATKTTTWRTMTTLLPCWRTSPEAP